MNDPVVELLNLVTAALDNVGITYAVTGSVASSIHGEPLMSEDVDIVVNMTPEQARRLALKLPRRLYFTEEMLVDAARNHRMANLVDLDSHLKMDLSVMPPSHFRQDVLSRARPTSFGADAPEFCTVTPEDVILMKLEWRKETQSAKQWENALSVVRVKGNALDWAYLFEGAERLGVLDDLRRLRDEGGI